MSKAPEKEVVIFTDGACSGNPGPGGYGAVLAYRGARKELSKGVRWTTNNRMELLAVISAVAAIKEPCKLRIYSDSKYVLGAYEKGWLELWRKNGWKTANNNPVQNQDLWEQLDLLLSHHETTFQWVKGHADIKENNRCDELAVEASKTRATLIDEGYELKNPFKINDGGRDVDNSR